MPISLTENFEIYHKVVLEISRRIAACIYLLLIARNSFVEIEKKSVSPEQIRGIYMAILAFQCSLVNNKFEWTLENLDSILPKVFFWVTSHITCGMNFWDRIIISPYVFLAGLLIPLISEASQQCIPFGSTQDMVGGRDTLDRNLLIWGTQLALGNS